MLLEEAETVISRAMQVPIFRIPETQISLYEEKLENEDKNSISNSKSSIFGNENSEGHEKR